MAATRCSSELLEAIRTGAGLDYLSDVHDKRYRERVRRSIENLPDEQFDAGAWQAAMEYILKDRFDCNGISDVRSYLLRRMEP